MYPKTFDDLIYEFQKLPGVGAKTAERYAFTVLGWSDEEISELAETVVPVRIYLYKGLAKLEIALAKGKNLHDKRESQKAKDAQREIQKALKNQY